MPYLLIAGPDCSFEQRKIMAAELTDAIQTALRLPDELRDRITVQFLPASPERLAIGGRMLSELEEPEYYCQYMDIDLTTAKKEAIILHVFPLLMELLNVPNDQAQRIKLLFQDCTADNIVIGGQFLSDLLALKQV